MPDPAPTPAAGLSDGGMGVIPDPMRRRLAFLAVTRPQDLVGATEFLEQTLSPHRIPFCLIVDLGLCEGFDVSALRALLLLCDQVEKAGGELRLVVSTSSRINGTLAFFGLRSRLQVYATLPEACAGAMIGRTKVEPSGVLGSQEAC